MEPIQNLLYMLTMAFIQKHSASLASQTLTLHNVLCTYQYYAPLPPVRARMGDLTFSKIECPPTGAIFSSQNASVKTAKLFSFSVFRRFSDLYQVAQRFMKIKSPTPRVRSRSQFPPQSPVFPHLCPYAIFYLTHPFGT